MYVARIFHTNILVKSII